MTQRAVAPIPAEEPPPPSPHDEDAELVERMRADPLAAAPMLYARFAPLINRLVWRLLGADPDHNDVVQQIFYRILKQWARVRDPAKLEGWVQTIAVNAVYELLRRRNVRRVFLRSLPTETHPDLVRDVEVRDLLLRTRAVIERLAPKDRLAFMLYFVERRTLAEIAELGGYSLTTAKRRVARANRRFQSLLSQNPDLERLLLARVKKR